MSAHEFHLKPSKRYILLLSVVLFISVIVALVLPVAAWLKILIVAAVIIYGGWLVMRFGLLLLPDSIVSLTHQTGKSWILKTQSAQFVAELCGDSTVTYSVSVLRFKIEGQFWTQTCIIFRDSLAINEYQQLIVMLRMY